MLSLSWPAWSFPNRYDAEIRTATKLYLPGVDPRLVKAQLYQESRLDPGAVSPVGAQGVAQFMPATWQEVSRQLGFEHQDPHVAAPAIQAAAFYMAKLRKQWRSERPDADRHSLAMASYNAGLGNLVKAQRLCNGLLLYSEIIECLPGVTGHHSNETITYVKRIWGYFSQMIIGGW